MDTKLNPGHWAMMGILTLLLLATRDNHFASLHTLPGASWAVFFIAGFYLAAVWPLAFFMAAAGLIDLHAYGQGGEALMCFTKAYPLLLPAYTAMWLGGRWLSNRWHHYAQTTSVRRAPRAMLGSFVIAVLGSCFFCELFSGGGFYFFSGQVSNPTLSGYFFDNFIRYHPGYLGSAFFYIAIALALQAAYQGAWAGRLKGFTDQTATTDK